MLGKIAVLLRIAFRNLFKSRINLLIGAVVMGGTFLVVVGGALLDSVVSSIAGASSGASPATSRFTAHVARTTSPSGRWAATTPT